MFGIILDNSTTIRLFLQQEWDFPGWEWYQTHNPEEALKIIKSTQVDFLSTSQELLELKGLDLIKEVRKLDLYQPIISLISSYVDKEFVETAYKLGADIVLPKQFSKGDVRAGFFRIFQPGDYLKSILIIDDSAINRHLLVQPMKKYNFQILEAESVTEALEVLEDNFMNIVLVVSDENMEDGNGSNLCYQIRKSPQMATIPFFLLSAESEENLKKLRNEVWLNGYFVKPVNPRLIVEVAKVFQKNWHSHRKDFKTVLPEEFHSSVFE